MEEGPISNNCYHPIWMLMIDCFREPLSHWNAHPHMIDRIQHLQRRERTQADTPYITA